MDIGDLLCGTGKHKRIVRACTAMKNHKEDSIPFHHQMSFGGRFLYYKGMFYNT